jgi:hypothetical protein
VFPLRRDPPPDLARFSHAFGGFAISYYSPISISLFTTKSNILQVVFDIGHRKWISRGAAELLSEPPANTANIQIDRSSLSSDGI